MCLVSRSLPKIAEKDFPVYKVYLVEEVIHGKYIIESPYQRELAKINKLLVAKGSPTPHYTSDKAFIYGCGYFHSLLSFYHVQREMTDIHLWNPNFNLVILKCIVPRNTYYVRGTYCGMDGIASENLIVTKEIALANFNTENFEKYLEKCVYSLHLD